jgi:hypothetical protein
LIALNRGELTGYLNILTSIPLLGRPFFNTPRGLVLRQADQADQEVHVMNFSFSRNNGGFSPVGSAIVSKQRCRPYWPHATRDDSAPYIESVAIFHRHRIILIEINLIVIKFTCSEVADPFVTCAGNPFTRQYVFFSRAGFTEPAQALASSAGAILVNLYGLDAVLAEAIR